MKRREFIALLGGVAATWPRGARAQRQPALRRIGVLTSAGLDDIEGQARYAAFVQGLQQLGWIDGHNIRIDPRWGSGNTEEIRRHVAELVALVPDVMLVVGSAAMGPLFLLSVL
jgi:putative ABC transport system substrate-binding protein